MVRFGVMEGLCASLLGVCGTEWAVVHVDDFDVQGFITTAGSEVHRRDSCTNGRISGPVGHRVAFETG